MNKFIFVRVLSTTSFQKCEDSHTKCICRHFSLFGYFHICAKTVEFCKCVNLICIIFNFQTEKISKEILIV